MPDAQPHAATPPAPPSELANLRAMLDEMTLAPEIVRPSKFWEGLNERNLRQLEEAGLDYFKQTVNRNYFQFLPTDPRSEQFRAITARWIRRPTPRVLSARLSDPSSFSVSARWLRPVVVRVKAVLYAFYVAMLWEYVRRQDRRGLLDRIAEPALGHPISVEYRGRRISEDLCNSVLELTRMTEGLGGAPEAGDRIVELGGGYGRIAWAFLQAFPGIRYVLVDIPPALAIAEEYLSALFPERRIFGFRHFDAYEDVREELDAAEIAFLTPNQLDLVEPLGARLFINVSSLHEMRPEQIRHYLSCVGRHCSGYFYTKQWLRSVNPDDGVVILREDYPIPASWTAVFDRRHEVQSQFFEAMYRLPATA